MIVDKFKRKITIRHIKNKSKLKKTMMHDNKHRKIEVNNRMIIMRYRAKVRTVMAINR